MPKPPKHVTFKKTRNGHNNLKIKEFAINSYWTEDIKKKINIANNISKFRNNIYYLPPDTYLLISNIEDGKFFNKVTLTKDNEKAIKTQYEEYIKNNKDDKNKLEDIFTNNIEKAIDKINKFIDDIISKIAANNNNITEANLLLKSESELIELLDKDDSNLLNKLNELISTLLSIYKRPDKTEIESFVNTLFDLFELVNNINQIGPDGIIVIPDKSQVIELYNKYNSASDAFIDKMIALEESIKNEYKKRKQKENNEREQKENNERKQKEYNERKQKEYNEREQKAIKAIKEKKILFI